MSRVRIILDPGKLSNPDLDIRYSLPEKLAALPGSTLADDGYDYTESSPPFLVVFLTSDAPERDAQLSVEFLRSTPVLENNILDAATVCICGDNDDWRQVYPTSRQD